MKGLLICIITGCFVTQSCTNSGQHDAESAWEIRKTEVLTLDDLPQWDTTGKQSIYREISPYEAKGIDPPEGEEERIYERYDRPYSPFEFIENAHSNLTSMGYEVGTIVEFSHNLLRDTVWAKKVYQILDDHSTRSYLGSKQGFLDSIKSVNSILISPRNQSPDIKE